MSKSSAAEIDRLYALPLDEFVAERDALAKRLRKEDREAAEAVKTLKKPSVAAWAVNQVRRDRPEDVRRLLEVTEELHRVYSGLGSAGARERLGDAASMQRDLIASLTRCARELLEAGGLVASEATLNKVADTFRAAAIDENLRELVAAGRVVKEQQAAGFGPLASLPAPKRKPKGKAKAKPKRKPKPDPRAKEREAAKNELERVRKELEEAERRLKELG